MNTTTKSIHQLCSDLGQTMSPQRCNDLANDMLDRLEAAEVRIKDLQQLMAQGHSKARKHGLQLDALRRELYRTQMVLEGVSADYGDSPMAIQARPPVDDVSRLLDERLKRDAARIGELEAQLKAIGIALEWPPQEEDQTLLEAVKEAAMDGVLRCQQFAEMHRLRTAQQPRPMEDAPRDADIMLAIGARYRGDEAEPFRMGLLGWLPLPDQSDKTSDPIDELLPMHSDVPDMWLIRHRAGDRCSWWKEHGRGLVTDVLAAGLHTEDDARHAVCGRPDVLEAVRLGDALNGLSCKGTVAELLGWLPYQTEDKS